MANQPIGISFLPSAENQAQGPQRQGMEGGGGDLAQAWKILSLQLPRVLGARSLAPKRLLTGAGSAGMQGNPSAEAFKALLKAMLGGQSYLPTPETSARTGGVRYGELLPPGPISPAPSNAGRSPVPQVIPGREGRWPMPPRDSQPVPVPPGSPNYDYTNPPQVPTWNRPAPTPLDPWGDFGGGTYGTEG